MLDGAGLTPAALARIARERAPVALAPAARQRNAAAAAALATLIGAACRSTAPAPGSAR